MGGVGVGFGKSQKTRTVVEKPYHIVGKGSSEELGKYLARNGHALLPMVDLIEQSKLAVDELIDVLGQAQVEAVLRLSAERIAAPPRSAGKPASRYSFGRLRRGGKVEPGGTITQSLHV